MSGREEVGEASSGKSRGKRKTRSDDSDASENGESYGKRKTRSDDSDASGHGKSSGKRKTRSEPEQRPYAWWDEKFKNAPGRRKLPGWLVRAAIKQAKRLSLNQEDMPEQSISEIRPWMAVKQYCPFPDSDDKTVQFDARTEARIVAVWWLLDAFCRHNERYNIHGLPEGSSLRVAHDWLREAFNQFLVKYKRSELDKPRADVGSNTAQSMTENMKLKVQMDEMEELLEKLSLGQRG